MNERLRRKAVGSTILFAALQLTSNSARAQAQSVGDTASFDASVDADAQSHNPRALPTESNPDYRQFIAPFLFSGADLAPPIGDATEAGSWPIWPHRPPVNDAATASQDAIEHEDPPGPRNAADRDDVSPRCAGYYGDRRYFVIRHDAKTGRWFHGDYRSRGIVRENHPIPSQHIVICIDDEDLRSNYAVSVATTAIENTTSGPSLSVTPSESFTHFLAAPTRTEIQRILSANALALYQLVQGSVAGRTTRREATNRRQASSRTQPDNITTHEDLEAQLRENSRVIAALLSELYHLRAVSTDTPRTAAQAYPGNQRQPEQAVPLESQSMVDVRFSHSDTPLLIRQLEHAQSQTNEQLRYVAESATAGTRIPLFRDAQNAVELARLRLDQARSSAARDADQRYTRAAGEWLRADGERRRAASLRAIISNALAYRDRLLPVVYVVLSRTIHDYSGKVLWAATYLRDRRLLAVYEALDRLSHPVVPDTLSELDVTLRSLLFPRSVAEVDCQNSACGLEADLASILPGDVRVAGGGVYYLPIPRASLADAGAGDARAEIAADGVIPNSILQALQQEIALSTRAGEYLTQFSRSLRQSQRVFDLGSFGENRLVSISIKRTQRLLEFNDGTLRIVPREDIVTRTETVESIERFFVRAGVAVTTSPSQTFTASRNNAGDVVIGATTDYASIVHPIVMASFDLCGVNPRVTPVHRECQSGNRFQGIRWWWLIPAPSIGFSTTSKIFETLFLGATWSPTNFFSFGAGIQIAQQQRLRQGFLLGDPLNGIELSSVHQGTVVANPYFSFTLSSEVFSAMRGFQQ